MNEAKKNLVRQILRARASLGKPVTYRQALALVREIEKISLEINESLKESLDKRSDSR